MADKFPTIPESKLPSKAEMADRMAGRKSELRKTVTTPGLGGAKSPG